MEYNQLCFKNVITNNILMSNVIIAINRFESTCLGYEK